MDFRVFGGGGGGLLSIFIGSGGVNCGRRKSFRVRNSHKNKN